MIVYADAERTEVFGDVRDDVVALLDRMGRASAGLARHEALVAAFIRAGELVQGIADAEFETRGRDAASEAQTLGAALMLAFAREIDRSWSSGFQSAPDATAARHLLVGIRFSGPIRTRTCEGYAHYALYPESYVDAAGRSGLDERTCVIGIRSIGIGLAALVAAALGAAPAISLRPAGPPFERRIRADPGLIAAASSDSSVRFAIVDEGPGLSGSSFAAVALWLRQNGVAAARISFFPSHEGQPGAKASAAIRAIWSQTSRHVARQDDIIFHRNGLRSWASNVLGSPIGPLRGITLNSMPQDPRFERRKFLARGKGGLWLLKFAGFGAVGERKLRDAVLLAQARFIPEVAGLCHGFMVQRWVDGRSPTPRFDRARLLRRIGEYLTFRALHLSTSRTGASLAMLQEMAVVNTQEALGSAAAAAMRALLRETGRFGLRMRQVRTDGRLHHWEWLDADGRLLKADAVDHCEGHDLIGCQDIAWDVAGAVVEHELSRAEVAELRLIMGLHDVETDRDLISALIPCYAAFQLGLWTGAEASGRADYYERHLRTILASC